MRFMTSPGRILRGACRNEHYEDVFAAGVFCWSAQYGRSFTSPIPLRRASSDRLEARIVYFFYSSIGGGDADFLLLEE